MTAPPPTTRTGFGRTELLLWLSLTMAVTALAIDLMLPAFGEIRADFGLAADSSATAAIVTVFMIGLATGQVFYGPFADRFGRKVVLYVAFGLYAVGALMAAVAPSFEWLLVGRLVWGIGSAGPRVMTLAIIRDTHQGDRMARTMSFVMAVFILVPVMAPSLGAALTAVAPWRVLFWLCVGYVAVIAVWTLRLPETLHPEHRIELRFDGIRRAARMVLGNRRTMAYTAAITVTFSGLVSYLATSELIVEDVFGLGDRFPLIFGGLAAVMGVAMLANGSLVERLGARRMVSWLVWGYVGAALILVLISMAAGGTPPFWAFLLPLAAVLVMNAFLFPNLNTLALEPMGEVAGTAAAIIGTIQTGGGALLGSFIDRAYDGTTTPLTVGFLLAGLVAFACVRWGASQED